jgi:hypothetical protein
MREHPDRFITEDDIEKLKDQVKKLVMLPGEEIIHVFLRNTKWILKAKSGTNWNARQKFRSQFPCCCGTNGKHQKYRKMCSRSWS